MTFSCLSLISPLSLIQSTVLGVPENCFYREIINSDSDIYWGSNMGNSGGLQAEKKTCHGMPYSINLVIPPLSVIILKPQHS